MRRQRTSKLERQATIDKKVEEQKRKMRYLDEASTMIKTLM